MDLNHFYMNQEDRHMQGEIHTSLIQYLGHQFSDVLRPAPGPGEQIPTLNELSEGNQQVIVIYRSGTRDDKIINGSSLQNKIKENKLWPGTWIESPWANTMDVTHCLGELEASAKNREGSIFHVFQAVLTPDADYIGPNCRCKCCGSVEADCADVINPQLMEWIKKDALKGSRGMIYITDFVDKPEDFVASVVSLNGQAK
nr:hypothetical protein BaRGS_007939 [Batillaria attramentaria]